MTEENPDYTTEQNHAYAAKQKRVKAIEVVIHRYLAGEITQAEATAEIEAITHEK